GRAGGGQAQLEPFEALVRDARGGARAFALAESAAQERARAARARGAVRLAARPLPGRERRGFLRATPGGGARAQQSRAEPERAHERLVHDRARRQLSASGGAGLEFESAVEAAWDQHGTHVDEGSNGGREVAGGR